VLGELFRAPLEERAMQGDKFRAQDSETWRHWNQQHHCSPPTRDCWNRRHLCAQKLHQKRPFLTRKGDGGFNPTQAQASKGGDGFSW